MKNVKLKMKNNGMTDRLSGERRFLRFGESGGMLLCDA